MLLARDLIWHALRDTCILEGNPFILFLSGCCDNTNGWVVYQRLFPPVLEAGKSKIKALADLVSEEGLLPGP